MRVQALAHAHTGRPGQVWWKTGDSPAVLVGSLPGPLSCRPNGEAGSSSCPFGQTCLQSCYCFSQVTNVTGLGQPSCFHAHQMRRVLCFNCHICCLEGGSDHGVFWVTFLLELHANGPAKGCDWSGKVISVCLDGFLH